MTETVRIATPADEGNLYDLLVDLHRHNAAGWGAPFSPQLVFAQIEVGTRANISTRTNLNDRRLGRIGVIGEPGGRLVGSIGLFVDPQAWFTDQAYCLVELWVYVRPEARDRRKLERALFAFANAHHAEVKASLLKSGYEFSFPMQSGFLFDSEGKIGRHSKFSVMTELWRPAYWGEASGGFYLGRTRAALKQPPP